MLLPPQDGACAGPSEYVPGLQPAVSRGNRLRFGWGMAWLALVTVPFSLVQIAAYQRDPTARGFKRWARRWGRAVLGGLGIRVAVERRAALEPGRPYVFAANHQNLLDVLMLAEALPYPFGFVAKAELEDVPFLGLAIRNSACLFIDRRDPRRMIESMRAAAGRIREGNSVLIYPEGERSYGPVMKPFLKGAFALAVEAGVPVVPVTTVDAYRLMDERRRVLRPGTARVVVGAPIPTEGLYRRDLPCLMADVRAQMEGELRAEREAWRWRLALRPVSNDE